jgi:hypothetical protein
VTVIIGTAPIKTTNNILFIDSWNKRCVVSGNASTPVVRDMINPSLQAVAQSGVTFSGLPSRDFYYNGTALSSVAVNSVYDNIFATGGTVMIAFKSYSVNINGSRVIGKVSDSSEFLLGWWMNLSDLSVSNCRLQFMRSMTTNYGLWQTSSRVIPMNLWNIVHLVYNDASFSTSPIVYLNGVVQGMSVTQAPTGAVVSDNGRNVQIGNGLSTSRPFNGLIDVVVMSNTIWSAAEVLDSVVSFADRFAIKGGAY